MLLTDYLRTEDRTPHFYESSWQDVQTWVQGLGVDFRLNDAPLGTDVRQIGASCGIVAASVTMMLRRRGDADLFEHCTHDATGQDKIGAFNAHLLAAHEREPHWPPSPHLQAGGTLFLDMVDVDRACTLFNDRQPCADFHREGWGLKVNGLDHFIENVAKILSKATSPDVHGEHYFVVNNQPGGVRGDQWVSVVLEIKPRDDGHTRAPVRKRQRASSPSQQPECKEETKSRPLAVEESSAAHGGGPEQMEVEYSQYSTSILLVLARDLAVGLVVARACMCAVVLLWLRRLPGRWGRSGQRTRKPCSDHSR
jgi:hypothetical protein